MPVAYQMPMDAQIAAPPAAVYSQAAATMPYTGNAAAQRYMAEQAGRGYGQADYGSSSVQLAAAQMAPAAAMPAGGNPFQPQPTVVPVQYSNAVPTYAQPAPPVPSFQAPGYVATPSYQAPQQQTYAAPAYPTYQAPQPTYQAPAYQPPAYQAPTYQAPTYQTYQAPTYAAPTYAAPTYQAPVQSYNVPDSTYPAYAFQQPAPQVVYQSRVSTRKTRAAARRQQKQAVKTQKAQVRAAQRAQTYVAPQPAPQAYASVPPAYVYGGSAPAMPYGGYYQQQPSYPQGGYAQPTYPTQTYPTPAAPTYAQPSYPAPTYQPPGYYPQSYTPQPAYPAGAPTVAYGTDAEMARINAEIAALSADRAPGVEGAIGYRYRDGEEGLGQLNEVSGRVAASTGLGPGRVELSVAPVYIDSGTPSGPALARFGTNPLPQALAVAGGYTAAFPAPPNQDDAGVAVRLGYETGNITADVGTTPIGFTKTKFQGGARWAPQLTRTVNARVFVERRPVTDSVLSYAGTDDPATGVNWGQVMRTGGGVGISVDPGQGVGFYVDGNAYGYAGRNVRDNKSIEFNAGGYLTAWRRDTSQLTIGANVNYQHYANNQNFFSYGHGGYFSPQQYISIGFPVRYRSVNGPLSLDLTATPGFQTYRQNGEAVFPTSDPLQAALLRLNAANSQVLARYGSVTKSGLGLALQGVAWYRVAPGTAIGGDLRFNTFGAYNEAQATLRLRQSLGSLQ